MMSKEGLDFVRWFARDEIKLQGGLSTKKGRSATSDLYTGFMIHFEDFGVQDLIDNKRTLEGVILLPRLWRRLPA